jgi:hypothetical protein
MSTKKIKPRSGSYRLPNYKNIEAWFYTNRGSIDLVVHQEGVPVKSIIYRFRLRDMREIVKALSRKS